MDIYPSKRMPSSLDGKNHLFLLQQNRGNFQEMKIHSLSTNFVKNDNFGCENIPIKKIVTRTFEDHSYELR